MEQHALLVVVGVTRQIRGELGQQEQALGHGHAVDSRSDVHKVKVLYEGVGTAGSRIFELVQQGGDGQEDGIRFDAGVYVRA